MTARVVGHEFGDVMTEVIEKIEPSTVRGDGAATVGRDGMDKPVSAEAAMQQAVEAAVDPMSDEGLGVGLNTMLRDEPGYRIGLSVEAFDDQNALQMVLRTVDGISWWKSLSYFLAVQGNRGVGPEIRIETKNRVHEARQYLFLPDLTRYGVFELWKGGIGGWGAFAGSLPINSFANRGRSVIFTWYED